MFDGELLARLTRLEQKQEAVIAGIGGLAEVIETQTEILEEVVAWLKEPPKGDLPAVLERLAVAVEATHEDMRALSRAVMNGEGDGRG